MPLNIRFSAKVIDAARLRRLSREGFWVLFGQILTVSGSLFGVRILTEFLNPTAYGELALGMTIATVANQVLLGPFNQGVSRFYAPAVERGDLRGYFQAVGRLMLLAGGVLVLVGFFGIFGLAMAGRAEWLAITAGAFSFAVFSGFNTVLRGIQNAARQRNVVAILQGIEVWGRWLFAAGFLLCWGTRSAMAMYGYAVAAALIFFSQLAFMQNIGSERFSVRLKSNEWLKNIWTYSWPFSVWGIFTAVHLASDRWALEIFSTTKDVGFYLVLFQIGYLPITLLTGIFTQFLAPIFYQRVGDGRDEQRRSSVHHLSWRLTWLALTLTGGVYLFTRAFHDQIFKIFVGKEYLSISNLLPFMVLSGGIFAAAQIVSLNLMSQMKTRNMMMPKIITALIGVSLNLLGAHLIGLKGVVMASILFSGIHFLWMATLSRKLS